MKQANILLVDDHPMLRKGVAQLISLEDNLNVVGEVNSGDEAIMFAIISAILSEAISVV